MFVCSARSQQVIVCTLAPTLPLTNSSANKIKAIVPAMESSFKRCSTTSCEVPFDRFSKGEDPGEKQEALFHASQNLRLGTILQ